MRESHFHMRAWCVKNEEKTEIFKVMSKFMF